MPVYQQEGILLKRIFTKALCLVCVGALALSLTACGGKADSAASSTASSSTLGSAADYDYQNFNYSDGLDEKGYWEGIRALDYVTLPEDFASVAVKRSDVEPTSEEVEKQISDVLSRYSSTNHVTDRAAADGDTVTVKLGVVGAIYDDIWKPAQEALKAEGIQTAVFSNKADAFCGKIIEHYFGPGSFSLVRGSRPGVPTKPDPAGVYSLMADLGAAPESTLFVGDSDGDILTGHNAGLPALGVLWGFRGEAELTAAGADALAAKPEDILAYLRCEKH